MKIYYESKPGELEHGMLSKIFKPKYLKKVPNGNGGYRYLYTQDEVDAYNKSVTAKYADKRNQARANAQKNQYKKTDKTSYKVLGDKTVGISNNNYTAKTYVKVSGDPSSRYGIYKSYDGKTTYRHEPTNKLFSSKGTTTIEVGGEKYITTTEYDGKLERGAEYIKNLFKKKKKKK